MSRRSERESDIVETAATIAVGAAAAYGCYKLYQSVSDSNRPQQVVVEESSMNSHRRDSPPQPSFGATVSNAIGGMQLAYTGSKLCESLLNAMQQEEPQRAQSNHSSQPIQSSLYPDLSQSERSIPSTRIENKPSMSEPSSNGTKVMETMQALYGGYKLCQSLFGSKSSNSASGDYHQPKLRAVVVETEKNANEALKNLEEYVDF